MSILPANPASLDQGKSQSRPQVVYFPSGVLVCLLSGAPTVSWPVAHFSARVSIEDAEQVKLNVRLGTISLVTALVAMSCLTARRHNIPVALYGGPGADILFAESS